MARRYKRKSNGQFAGGGGTSVGSGTKAKMGTNKRAKISRQRRRRIVAGGVIGANVAAFATGGNPVAIYAGFAGGAAAGNRLGKKRDAELAKSAARPGSKLKPGIKS